LTAGTDPIRIGTLLLSGCIAPHNRICVSNWRRGPTASRPTRRARGFIPFLAGATTDMGDSVFEPARACFGGPNLAVRKRKLQNGAWKLTPAVRQRPEAALSSAQRLGEHAVQDVPDRARRKSLQVYKLQVLRLHHNLLEHATARMEGLRSITTTSMLFAAHNGSRRKYTALFQSYGRRSVSLAATTHGT